MDISALQNYLSQYGLICIFVVIFLEYLNLPGFPAGIILPLAGIWIADSGASLFVGIVVSVLAGIVGSWMLYFLGLYGGSFLLEKYLTRFPKYEAVVSDSMEKLRKYGNAGVFICKLMPVVRTVISIPAGVLRLDFVSYTVFSAVGIFIWNGVLMGLGYILGDVLLQNII